MHKFKKPLLISFGVVIVIAAIVIVFISPITKFLVQKYDVKYLGREITLDWAYVNPFTGYVHLSGVKIYELKSDSVFFSAKGISSNFAMLKLFSKTYEISMLTLNHPVGIINQNKQNFNFSDLIELFTPKEPRDTTKPPLKFNLLDIKIKQGIFHYYEKNIPVNYFVKDVNIESTGMWWNRDTLDAKFSFLQGVGAGDIKGNTTINLKNLDYRVAVEVEKFDLNIIEQYLKDLTNHGTFSANIDANIKAAGNFNNQENLTASGQIAINEFHFGRTPKDDYLSFEKLSLDIIEASPKNKKYLIDSIILDKPYFKYERYDYLDNLQTMFGKGGENIKSAAADDAQFNLIIEIARYVEVIAKNFLRSDYLINRLAINDGDIKFNDYSTSEKFSVDLNPLNIEADSIDKSHSRINVNLVSGIKPYGNVKVALSINPQDSSDFDLQYNFQKLPVSMFNPYIITYTSFPLDRGTLELKGTWKVRNGNIQSDNHLLVIDPRITRRLRNKDTKWIPVPLIMALVRERGNVIDYEIPITGDLKSPKFNVWDVIGDLLKNIFVKPVTTPYRMQVKNIERDIEKSLTLKWNTKSFSLNNTQEKFIERMVHFLKTNPEAVIAIAPQNYELKEKEYLLLFEAKKKYYQTTNNINAQSFSEDDSVAVEKMSVKDSLFVAFLNRQVNDSMIFTVQEKCAVIVGAATINTKFEVLNANRAKAFLNFFDNISREQIKFLKSENVVPFNGFSFYKIDYEGNYPETLIKAHEQMNELNEDSPRKEYLKEREKIKNVL
jgi:hypothetical protein